MGFDERKELGEKVQEKIKEKNAVRDEFRAKEREYYAYQAEVRKARQEKYQEQRYVAEITLIEQTIAFCNSLTQKKAEDAKEEKKEVAHDNPEGTQVLMKKEDRDNEFYMLPAKGKK